MRKHTNPVGVREVAKLIETLNEHDPILVANGIDGASLKVRRARLTAKRTWYHQEGPGAV